MSKILVTGATGSLGKQTLQFLSSKTEPSSLIALVRDESKATELKEMGIKIRIGDYDNPETLKEAFKGVDKLFFVSASDLEKRLPQHENILEAAKESDINHIVYTSFLRKDESDSSPIAAVAKAHIFSEEYLINSGITYTILRNTLYMDFAPFFIGNKVLENQMVYLPSGNGKASFLLRSEMAEIAAKILTEEGHENKIYTLAGDKGYSYGDIAKIISEISGKEIRFVSPPIGEYKETMEKAGAPEDMINLNIGFSLAIQQGEFEATNPKISELLGRKPTSMKDFLKNIYA